METLHPMRHLVPDQNSAPMAHDETQGNGHGTSCRDQSALPMIDTGHDLGLSLTGKIKSLSVWSSQLLQLKWHNSLKLLSGVSPGDGMKRKQPQVSSWFCFSIQCM